MITLQELCLTLDELLDVPTFSDYCPNGLQVQGTPEIKKVATAVSASLATIQTAVDHGVNALIVHHGMFWKGDSYVVSGVKREKLHLLLKNNISLLAYHLPLDAHQELGNNWKAAQDMQWKNLTPFGEFNGTPIGVKGTINPQSVSDFQKTLENYYQHPANCVFGGKQEVESVGLISGGAYKMISDAIREGLDCFVTGNFDEPVWHQAFEEKVNFFAMGHSATERIGPQALGNHLKEHFGIESTFIDIPNPF
ncbi:MAG: hypothetical protein K940chlam7_00395 [Chlamydiae bacterium]|nr:hypothetical protein [Chlamydiota bacterium]